MCETSPTASIDDYSFSEVCQIVESSGGTIHGLFISESNATTVKITIKLNAQDINEILEFNLIVD